MGLLSYIKRLIKPAYQTGSYQQMLEHLYEKRSGLLQLENKTALPDNDMLPLVGKLNAHVWAAKLLIEKKHDRFYVYYYGDINNEVICCLPEAFPIRMKVVNSTTKEEIELFDEALDGYNAVLNNFFKEDQLLERPIDKKYLTPEGVDEFRILVVVRYDENTENELTEVFEKNRKILDDDNREVDYELALKNSFSSILIYAIDANGNSFEIINQETA